MAAKYLFRIDDACPTMNWANFTALRNLFKEFNIKPIVGIIPDNQDPKLKTQPIRHDFWQVMKQLSQEGWIIAQHGYQHLYVTKQGGLLNINQKSEFAGLSLAQQKAKIQAGHAILQQHLGVSVIWWMAPAHSFDIYTCQALTELGFTTITDGLALYPFQKYGLRWIPQQLWRPKTKAFGLWTICIHPDTINQSYINTLRTFLEHQKNSKINQSDFTPRFTIINELYAFWWKFQYTIYKTFWK